MTVKRAAVAVAAAAALHLVYVNGLEHLVAQGEKELHGLALAGMEQMRVSPGRGRGGEASGREGDADGQTGGDVGGWRRARARARARARRCKKGQRAKAKISNQSPEAFFVSSSLSFALSLHAFAVSSSGSTPSVFSPNDIQPAQPHGASDGALGD